VAAVERDIAGVARIRINRKRVALDDGARQIEGRVLIPSAAGEKVCIRCEREQPEPLRDSLVVLRNVGR